MVSKIKLHIVHLYNFLKIRRVVFVMSIFPIVFQVLYNSFLTLWCSKNPSIIYIFCYFVPDELRKTDDQHIFEIATTKLNLKTKKPENYSRQKRSSTEFRVTKCYSPRVGTCRGCRDPSLPAGSQSSPSGTGHSYQGNNRYQDLY